MAEYAYQKKDAQEVRTPKVQQADPVRFHSVPNSLFVGQDDRIDSNLGALMRERVAALQRQIPSAEREADRLSQGITATTPEGVRQQMGEKLGADFSNVRMYTDQSAANKADRMGAKAYTSGQNVYFGSGGFVPQVAAHELVHTVQQGIVDGVGVQQSVSFGAVQMCPFNRKVGEMAVPGDADFIGPFKKSWKLTPHGDGAHLVERVNTRGRPDMAQFNTAQTPRFYPYGSEENAGQAHIRMHESTRNAGIRLQGGNPNMSSQELMNRYKNAYNAPSLQHIRGDLRTPDSSTVIATNVSVGEAFRRLEQMYPLNKN